MCRSLKIMCAAPGRERLTEVKMAAVAAQWELVGGACSLEDLTPQLEQWEPDVLVVDEALGADAVARAREAAPRVRIVAIVDPGPAGSGGTVGDRVLGSAGGADEVVESLDEVRAAVLGLSRPGGPVRS